MLASYGVTSRQALSTSKLNDGTQLDHGSVGRSIVVYSYTNVRSKRFSLKIMFSRVNWINCKHILLFSSLIEQSPDSSGATIDLTNFDVTDGNYTKRKNVFRLSSAHYPAACDNECELLLQTQSQQDMTDWMSCLKAISRSDIEAMTVSWWSVPVASIWCWLFFPLFVSNLTELKRRNLNVSLPWSRCKLRHWLAAMTILHPSHQKLNENTTSDRDRLPANRRSLKVEKRLRISSSPQRRRWIQIKTAPTRKPTHRNKSRGNILWRISLRRCKTHLTQIRHMTTSPNAVLSLNVHR